MSKPIPKTFFNLLPLPIIIVKHDENSLNHKLVFLNNSFTQMIGWDLTEIPDKSHWWNVAYPEPHYQKVVEDLWELNMESLDSEDDSFIQMTVNIMTKHNGSKRFDVYTELKSALLDGYYVVAFKEVGG